MALKEKHGYYWPNQFENEANAWIHRQTTAPEILEAMGGDRLDYFVCAYGTGGKLKGVGQVLREAQPGDEAAALRAVERAAAAERREDGLRRRRLDHQESHPVFRPHLLRGWTPDFVPAMVEHATQHGLYDELQHVSGDEAVAMAQELARAEGIFTGTSGGGVLHIALRKAATLAEGSTMVVMLPDTGERYLSTPLSTTCRRT